ncbi:hypothetical protein [Nocardioides mesophilus]|uniref:Nuclear transport factor 2 family protein n=1 Tax=Nocardioides mesophilus TaxID=433659 RepID=A0A7G9RC85_9ACTN|nr:hypothetical protein [Nocardioides mesophilus]QNN53210.1 hypothetical protein H9L09_01590 [Nocardioides mesophilus]
MRPLPGLCALSLLVLVLAGCGSGSPPASVRSSAPGAGARAVRAAPAAEGRVVAAARVLRRWDAARAVAYSRGSVPLLRRLYADGAGADDVRLLRDYARRGLRVQEMTTQLLAVEVLRHRPGLWRLRVTDRLSHAVAVGATGRVLLPRDDASTRTVQLVRQGGRWRAQRVSGPAPP